MTQAKTIIKKRYNTRALVFAWLVALYIAPVFPARAYIDVLDSQPDKSARFQFSGLRILELSPRQGAVSGLSLALTDNAGGTTTAVKLTCNNNPLMFAWSDFKPHFSGDSYSVPLVQEYYFSGYDLGACSGTTTAVLYPAGSYLWGKIDGAIENPYFVLYGLELTAPGYSLIINTLSKDITGTSSTENINISYTAPESVNLFLTIARYNNDATIVESFDNVAFDNPYVAMSTSTTATIDINTGVCGSYFITAVMLRPGDSVFNQNNFIVSSAPITINYCGQSLAELIRQAQANFSTTSTSTGAEISWSCDPNSNIWERSICNVAGFLFIPSQSALYRFSKLRDTYKNKPPFGYATSIFSAVSGITSSATPAFILSVATPALDNVFNPIKTGLSYIFWLMTGVYLFKRFKHFEL